MKIKSFILLASHWMLAAANSTNTIPLLRSRERQPDSQTIAVFSTTGLCFSYVDQDGNPVGGNREKSLEPCKTWCPTQGAPEGQYGCGSFIPSGTKFDPSTISEDDEGLLWTPAECTCDCDLCEDILNIVIEGLQQLDNIICAVMVSTFTTILEIGVEFVPGGQEVAALRIAIEGAKTFTENGLDAASFFGDWVGKACGVPNWDFDLLSVFNPLVNAPDSMGTSVGCSKKNKADCRSLDPKPDPPTTKDNDTPPKTAQDPPKTTQDPPNTTQIPPSTTQEASQATDASTTADASQTTQDASSITSSSTASSDSALATDCGTCGSGAVKRAAHQRRWGVMYGRGAASCVRDPDRNELDDEPSCQYSSTELTFPDVPDLTDRSTVSSLSPIEERGLSSKTEPITLVNPLGLTMTFGKYFPCSDAKSEADIEKNFVFKNELCTNAKVVQRSSQSSLLSGIALQTEHVYEAQTARDFFVWLSDGGTVGTHQKASKQWVEDVLLQESSPTAFRLVSPGTTAGNLGTQAAGDLLDDVIAIGFGRSDGVGRPKKVAQNDLLLLEDTINNNKGTWFKLQKPNFLQVKTGVNAITDPKIGRLKVKTGASPFKFMGMNTGTEPVWNKWMRVSNWIDHVLHEFDQQYPWGSQPGEPTRLAPNAQNLKPSLRALYASWIDDHLQSIEKNAADWSADIMKNYNARFDKEKDHKNYINNAFAPVTGFACKEQMKFPRPFTVNPANPTQVLPGAGTVSEYGAWGYDAMTFDYAGNRLATYIGPPPPI